jgi:mannose-6-phosphate isomerase-like protein (cupin superfamily)/putative sterol carrier protein
MQALQLQGREYRRALAMNWCIQILKKLLRDADLYKDLIPTVAQEIRVCVRLSDSMESATIVVADEMKVLEDSAKPDITLIMNSTALRDIVDGKADAFALIGRGRMDEKRPIEFEIHTKERTKEIWEVGKALLTYFFTPGKIKVKSLDPERAGHAHGAHPIPLVYWNGMRYSWILVKSGETLNKDGEKDPWPQAFVVLEGKGMATIRDTRFQIEAEKAIYVPTNSIHQITAEEDLKLLWLAWNAW